MPGFIDPVHAKVGKPTRPALVLVDMLEKDRGMFTYEHGPLSEGIRRTTDVIASFRSARMPLILVTGTRSREVFREIALASGPDALTVGKPKMSAFSAPDFQTILNAYDIDTIVLGGWIRHLCVMATASEAVSLGYRIRTSDQILFGNRELLNLQARRMCLEWFRRECSLLETSEELSASRQSGQM